MVDQSGGKKNNNWVPKKCHFDSMSLMGMLSTVTNRRVVLKLGAAAPSIFVERTFLDSINGFQLEIWATIALWNPTSCYFSWSLRVAPPKVVTMKFVKEHSPSKPGHVAMLIETWKKNSEGTQSCIALRPFQISFLSLEVLDVVVKLVRLVLRDTGVKKFGHLWLWHYSGGFLAPKRYKLLRSGEVLVCFVLM